MMKFRSRLMRTLSLPFSKTFSTSTLGREHIVHEDISNGREINKIPALSYKANDKAPDDFVYVTDHVTWSQTVDIDSNLANMDSCTCLGDCSENCACTSKVRFYDSQGLLSPEYNVDAPEIIKECNAKCSCNRRKCQNIVIQKGCKAKLALIRTKSRGWGVRTLEPLKRGTFLGVYSGELLAADQAFQRIDDTYLFNLSSTSTIEVSRVKREKAQQPSERVENGGNLVSEDDYDDNKNEDSSNIVEIHEYDSEEQPQQEEGQQVATFKPYVCDAKVFGNFTRFINHSCEPNVIGVKTFTAHQDKRFPYISFFANKDIPQNVELTLDYGENYWLVKCKRDGVYCLCKRPTCRFTKNSYPETLRRYNRRKREQDHA